MSSQKTSNNDSCRDLSGRRLSTVKEAKKFVLFSSDLFPFLALIWCGRLAAYLENEPERRKAASEARKAKIETLERQLGIDTSSDLSKATEVDKIAGTKRRFDDTEYIEQSRNIVDGVKNAVAAGVSTPTMKQPNLMNESMQVY